MRSRSDPAPPGAADPLPPDASRAWPGVDRPSDHAAREAEVFAQRLALMHGSGRVGQLMGIASLLLIGAALFRLAWPPPAFWLPAGLITAVLVLSLLSGRPPLPAALHAPAARRRETTLNVAHGLLVGLAWGSLFPLLMNTDPERIMILLCVAMALLFSFSMSCASFLPCVYALNLPLASMYAGSALLQPGLPPRLAAIAVLVMLGLLLAYAHQMHRAIVGSIRTTLRNRELNEALTEQRVQERTAALQAASRHKSAFVAQLSHELRTPLNTIIGYSELLQEEAAEQGRLAMVPDLQKIHHAGRHLLETISDVLDLSKIEAGRMELHAEDFALDALIGELRALVEPLAGQRGNRFEVTVGADAAPRLHADRPKLRQVLLNLLGNAAKFTRNGRITLAVAADADGTAIRFDVIDTGIGIDPAQLARLFEDFTQADDPAARGVAGSGLGLALSRRLCRLMGGDITVRSAPGAGSTFSVRLPLQPAPGTA